MDFTIILITGSLYDSILSSILKFDRYIKASRYHHCVRTYIKPKNLKNNAAHKSVIGGKSYFGLRGDMRKLGILFLLLFFGLTHVTTASNIYIETSSSDYISDAQYLQIINSTAEFTDQKCCIRHILDDKQKSSHCPNDAKLFTVSEPVMRWFQGAYIHPELEHISLQTLSSEFLRPPIA